MKLNELLDPVLGTIVFVGSVVALCYDVFMNPIARIGLALFPFFISGKYLYAVWRRLNSNQTSVLVDTDGNAIPNKPNYDLLRFPLMTFLVVMVLLAETIYFNLPGLAEPLNVISVKAESETLHTCRALDGEYEGRTLATIEETEVTQLSEAFAIERSRNLFGERVQIDFAVRDFLPSLSLQDLTVTVTDYKTFDEYHDEVFESGQERACSSMSGTQEGVPMEFVEIVSTEIGKSYAPRLVTTFSNNSVECAPWNMTKLRLENGLDETIMVHVGATNPGVYTYRLELVVKSRLGIYPPIIILSDRQVHFRTRKSIIS